MKTTALFYSIFYIVASSSDSEYGFSVNNSDKTKMKQNFIVE